MAKSPQRNQQKSLPRSLGQIDLPTPSRLTLFHAEQVCLNNERRMFSPTAKNLLCPLLAQASSSPSLINNFQSKLRMNGAYDYKYWFVFDRGYRLFEHKDAMETTREQLLAFPVVTSYPRSMYAGVAAMYLVGSEDDLQMLMQRSPIFGWLSSFAGGQNPDETWIYFFHALASMGKGKK